MPARPHRTTVTLMYDSARIARAIERSLDQEVGEIDDERSSTRLSRADTDLELTIDAADLTALRAAVNTWLSLATVAERVGETVDF